MTAMAMQYHVALYIQLKLHACIVDLQFKPAGYFVHQLLALNPHLLGVIVYVAAMLPPA